MQTHVIQTLLEEKINPLNIRKDEPMAAHTSFKIGGPAALFVSPTTVEELVAALQICKQEHVPYYVIGNGSNLLVPDEGIEGVVIAIHKNLSGIEQQGTTLKAYAGTLLSKVAKEAADHALTGLEFAHGIPGTLGGAVAMNAGAYGGEMKDVIRAVTLIDADGQLVTLTGEQMDFGYRESLVTKGDYIVVSATLELVSGDQATIQEKMKTLMASRRDKQPLEYPSAGSTFKRPTGYFAGKLIMDSQLAGYTIGGAQVSAKHCGFIVNKGNATCKDVLSLINYVQEEVKRQQGVVLETEVKLIGHKS